jgi:elongation factor G
MTDEIKALRNIGISAHIDAGKTTLTERILFYTKRIRAMHEVRGADGVGATMDSMDLERERGLTIQSAATSCSWRGARLNLIDTPGHVDFTIEVERALRVLDGAVLVLCGVAGVQSQTVTVNRQMERYRVPRIVFVNKCDRAGADPRRVVRQLREKLGLAAIPLQVPIGLESEHDGVVDLVTMEALTFEGRDGGAIKRGPIPPALEDETQAAREVLLDAAALHSDELTEAVLEGVEPPVQMVREAIRRGVLAMKLTPVLIGSAYKNRGVQPLLDAIDDYLPSPADAADEYHDLDAGNVVPIEPRADRPFLAFAFKLEDGRFGQLTYLRTYQGELRSGDVISNQRTGKSVRVGRLGRMHADTMEDISRAGPGDIVTLFGVECASGDTLTGSGLRASLTSMHVPEPVLSLSIRPVDRDSQMKMSQALRRFSREDPTFRYRVDDESGETLISGMGELHLEVYIERMRREYGAATTASPPQVAYREAITRRAPFNYTHKKQTGGSGQYGRIEGFLEPSDGDVEFEFVSRVTGGTVPTEYVPAVEKGFRAQIDEGMLIGFPVIALRVVLEDGAAHSVDSSDLAFQAAARGAFRQAYPQAAPRILEPVMKVAVDGPNEFQGAILRGLLARRGIVIGTSEERGFSTVEAEVPLCEMFGYSTDLRSSTQGKAEFSMQFARYSPVPSQLAEALRERYSERARRVGGSKEVGRG